MIALPVTPSIKVSINAVGSTSYALSMISRSSTHTMRSCSPGPGMSKRSMKRPSRGPRRDQINTALPTTRARRGRRNNTPLSNTSGCSANLMCEQSLHNIPYANESNNFYPNSSCSWRYLEFPPTTIWPSAVSALSSLLAKSVAGHLAPRDHTRAWVWLLSSELGRPNTSILSSNVSPS